MKKLLVINDCDDCKHFDNSYWGYEEYCMSLKRKIKRVINIYPIPDDCPLPNAEEK